MCSISLPSVPRHVLLIEKKKKSTYHLVTSPLSRLAVKQKSQTLEDCFSLFAR